MENIKKLTKVVANFVVVDGEISDYWLSKSFENGSEVSQNFDTVHLMMEEWCYFLLLGYTCTTSVVKENYGE